MTSELKRFRCANCKYAAKRKYTVDEHQQQHCKATTVHLFKDKTCMVCDKAFTHDGLRSHLRGYILSAEKKRKIRGIHQHFSIEEHRSLLDDIKKRQL